MEGRLNLRPTKAGRLPELGQPLLLDGPPFGGARGAGRGNSRKIMAQVEKRNVLLTPKFQVAFPQVAKMKVFAPGQKGRYSCVALRCSRLASSTRMTR